MQMDAGCYVYTYVRFFFEVESAFSDAQASCLETSFHFGLCVCLWFHTTCGQRPSPVPYNVPSKLVPQPMPSSSRKATINGGLAQAIQLSESHPPPPSFRNLLSVNVASEKLLHLSWVCIGQSRKAQILQVAGPPKMANVLQQKSTIYLEGYDYDYDSDCCFSIHFEVSHQKHCFGCVLLFWWMSQKVFGLTFFQQFLAGIKPLQE